MPQNCGKPWVSILLWHKRQFVSQHRGGLRDQIRSIFPAGQQVSHALVALTPSVIERGLSVFVFCIDPCSSREKDLHDLFVISLNPGDDSAHELWLQEANMVFRHVVLRPPSDRRPETETCL